MYEVCCIDVSGFVFIYMFKFLIYKFLFDIMNKDIKSFYWFFIMVKEKMIMVDDVYFRLIEYDGKSRNVLNFLIRV